MRRIRIAILTLMLSVCALLCAPWATSQEPGEKKGGRKGIPAKEGSPDAPATSGKEAPTKDNIATTTHGIKLPSGVNLPYEVDAGTMILKDDDGKARAEFSFFAYRKNGADAAKRPIILYAFRSDT